jgi:hypothetical protein
MKAGTFGEGWLDWEGEYVSTKTAKKQLKYSPVSSRHRANTDKGWIHADQGEGDGQTDKRKGTNGGRNKGGEARKQGGVNVSQH